MLLASGRNNTRNAGIVLGAHEGAKTAGNFLFHLHGTHIAFRLMVGKWHVRMLGKRQRRRCIGEQALGEVPPRRPFHFPFLMMARQGRFFLINLLAEPLIEPTPPGDIWDGTCVPLRPSVEQPSQGVHLERPVTTAFSDCRQFSQQMGATEGMATGGGGEITRPAIVDSPARIRREDTGRTCQRESPRFGGTPAYVRAGVVAT